MSQFREIRLFQSYKSLNLDFKEDEICVNFVEIAALEAAQKEIEQLKIKIEQLEGTCQNTFERWQNSLAREEHLEKALEVAEDAIQATLWQKVKGYPTWQEWENICVKNKDARLEIQIIKKELG